METNTSGKEGANRIKGYGINLLEASAKFPKNETAPDAIWMSQFTDCFSMEEIVSILSIAKEAMGDNTGNLYNGNIMGTVSVLNPRLSV